MKDINVSTYELIMSLSKAVDLVSPQLADHHIKVALISLNICNELNLPKEELCKIVLAAALHDIGAFSLKERLSFLSFEAENPHGHAYAGYKLLKSYEPFREAADIVRFHHVPWAYGDGTCAGNRRVPSGSHIVHIADRLAILLGSQREILLESATVTKIITDKSGRMFAPEYVEAIKNLSRKESFWLEITSPPDISNSLFPVIKSGSSELLDMTKLFSRIIDFRSRFTVNHSSGVASCARKLAELSGFSKKECDYMEIAGYLHDLGKLVIPAEILEKPSSLSTEEYKLVRGHTYYTYRILSPLKELHTINTWASYHHERLDGNGYPFRLKADELSLGSRILAAADVFTAIMEDRPYRIGMPEDKALKLLQNMANGQALDPNIVSLFTFHFDDINNERINAQKKTSAEYDDLSLDSNNLCATEKIS